MLERGGGGGSYRTREATYHCLPRSPHPLVLVRSSFPFLSLCLSYAFNLLLSVRLLHKLLIASNQTHRETRVGGRDKTPRVNQLRRSSFLPFPLSSRMLARSLFAYPYICLSLARSLETVDRLAPRTVHATRYLHATSAPPSRSLITSRPISVSYPCLHRKSRGPTVACLKFFVLVGRSH